MVGSLTRSRLQLLVMTLPSFLFVVAFSYVPIFGWAYALFDYRIGLRLFETRFRGLYFFMLALREPSLVRVLKNTIVIGVLSLSIIPAAGGVAIFLNEMSSRFYRRCIQTASTLPYFISWVIVYSIFFSFFAPESGLVNRILLRVGLIDTALNPLGNNAIVWYLQTGVSAWKHAGYLAIVFFAAITAIDPELYAAASVDGAGRMQKIVHITIPGLFPTLIMLLLINFGFLLSNGFDQFFVFYNPLVAENIEVLDYYVYRVGILQNDVPVATAISASKTLISVAMIFSLNWLAKGLLGRSLL